ncbi:U4/U6 small nuclear ribonucleoprotein prp4, partial [Chytriomyces hyalinus]
KEDAKLASGISEDVVAIGGEVDDEERLIEERRKRLLAIMQKHNSQSEVSVAASGNPFSATVSVASPAVSEGARLTHAESANAKSSPNANASNTHQSASQMDIDTEDALAKKLEQDQSDIAANLLTLENSNSKPVMPADGILAAENEISAADYDPNQDGANDDQHRHHIIGKGAEKEGAKQIAVVRDEDDMFNPSAVTAPVVPAKKKGKKKASVEVEFDMFADDDMFAVGGDAKPTKVTTHILDSAAVVRSSDNPALIDNWDDHEGYYRIILGEILDSRYHVYQNLGRGVFSGVVKARDTKNGDVDVAIKVIRNNDTMFRAGMKEIGILKKLQELDPEDKKHTIRLIRHFEHKNHLCMVFESMSMNLREVLKKFGKDIGLNIKAVRVYAQQLFLSLSLLRKANVLHADIKPDNVLVNESKNVLKLCDLGSASDASENEITPYLVSRFYRAPEIILGLPYDFAMDMWSIGCTLYELYTGKILFPGRSNNQMLRYMQETKGAFPKKMLRKGQFTHQHFDENMNFLQIDVDKVSGNSIVKPLSVTAPIKDLKTRLGGGAVGASKEEAKMIASFIDLLDKLLHLAPDKRMGVKEALVHPFITGQ